MKTGTGISASLVAILRSVATMSCCLPLGFAAALGAGTASAFFTTLNRELTPRRTRLSNHEIVLALVMRRSSGLNQFVLSYSKVLFYSSWFQFIALRRERIRSPRRYTEGRASELPRLFSRSNTCPQDSSPGRRSRRLAQNR